MEGFLKSFLPLIQRLRSEFILLTISIVIGLISLGLFIYDSKTIKQQDKLIQVLPTTSLLQKIMVDMGGAVLNPNIYEVTAGARLKDAIDLAGGLTEEADQLYIGRIFNLARILVDQDKIYIPTRQEMEAGYVNGATSNIPYSQASNINTALSSKININTATLTQLDTLPGVGTVTAENIISGRPYNSVDDLITKQAVKKALYDKIKDLVTIR